MSTTMVSTIRILCFDLINCYHPQNLGKPAVWFSHTSTLALTLILSLTIYCHVSEFLHRFRLQRSLGSGKH